MITNKQLEEFRKKECYCGDLAEIDTCEKCGQELQEWKGTKCMVCNWVDSLKKFANSGESEQ